MSIESIAHALGGAKKTTDGFLCKCPCHDDRTASLSITQGERELIYNCFAGCKWEDVKQKLTNMGLLPSNNGTYDKYAGAKFYTYRDKNGAILCRKVKMPDKKMWFERYESGQYIPGLQGAQIPLYNLQAVMNADLIYLCEGEKDAETIISAGLVGTTNHAGAKSWHPTLTEHLRNKSVIIIPDNDEAGRKRIDILTNALRNAARELRVFMPDGVEEHGDITDWVNNGNDPKTIFERAKVIHAQRAKLRAIKFTEIMSCELPEPDQIIENLFDTGDKMAVIGPSKAKKSYLITQLAFSLTTGTNFLGLHIPKPRKVLVVQYEIQPAHFMRRIRRMAEALGASIDDVEDRLMIVNARGINLDLEEVQTLIEEESVEVVMFDPFYKMFSGDESDIEEVKRILALFDRITTKSKCGLLYVHHDKKGSNEKTEQRDRGSGSGVLARDYDCSLAILEHETNDQAIVIDFLLRNYAFIPAIVAEWYDSHFRLTDLKPSVKKSGRRIAIFNIEKAANMALDLLPGVMPVALTTFRDQIRSELGVNRAQERQIIEHLLSSKAIIELRAVPFKGIPKRVQRNENLPDSGGSADLF